MKVVNVIIEVVYVMIKVVYVIMENDIKVVNSRVFITLQEK